MSLKYEKIKVFDMTCNSCEGRVERAIKKIEGVASAKASFSAQQVIVEYDSTLCNIKEIKESIKAAGYSTQDSNSYKLIGIFLVAAAIIYLGSRTAGFDMNERLNGASYLVLFIVGMLTSIHCVGMCGGIMLSQSISKEDKNRFKALQPALLYNLGRIVSYTIIGGIVGALGSVLSLSLTAKAFMQIFAGAFMIIMGSNMAGLRLFRKFNLRLPWSSCSVKKRPNTPFLVGMLNGLMPCGPLQTMQLYALGTGSAVRGAISMFLFSLGTVPLMLTFGAVSGLLSKGYTKKILKMSGFLVIILGLIMGNRGLALAGTGLPSIADIVKKVNSNSSAEAGLGKAIMKDKYQEINMTVDGSGFTPNVFYVKKNVPVKWIINGASINPCNNAIAVPALDKQFTVKSGENIVEFTPGDKDINFSCWMGMIKGQIKVAENLNSIDASKEASEATAEKAPSIYGDDLSKAPTDRLIKKVTLEDKAQTIRIRGIGYEFEPLVILANKGAQAKISMDLRAFDTPEEKFDIKDSSTKENIASIYGAKGIVSLDVKFDKTGSYAITNSKNVLTVIVVVDDISKVDLEQIRAQYVGK